VKRREFIALLGGAAAAWSLGARAQDSVRRVGVLMNLPADDPEAQAYMTAFQEGCRSEVGSSAGICGLIIVGP
jgi:hypothetical protein